ncbi:hypothetical protein AB4455_12275 [Vibrio sp. 10N.261.46.E12]|uniref:hypothetical protein n=1 Tax=unclassified Vibrio TaxID=2614977 RepID=UPI0009756620|nr:MULTISPECIES: hypothetical protein [unclassified Vibrio]OMO34214.1 hypothetical protein BH584_13425 [Vibrio sp. 10N.261.45.E1]PMJ33136.1 hypothetical protein BCU27_25170 [Vibrio sp. 10N.286.45.B6]PML86373.1 hypothetical protein BCT66_14375 [Vibrio sp. 10N.261.49.E11]PMM77489.1 hypothetical protein BCT48_23815 [Vibrio sp. 10N.261.46.F12]PMM90609.1 hypothetical protein BCT46_03300 [Vibrio sp. 10N.261.46.E8]
MKKLTIINRLIIDKVKGCPEAGDESFNRFMKQANQHAFDVIVIDERDSKQWTEESDYFHCSGAFGAYLGHEVVSHFIFQFDDESIGVYVPRGEDDFGGSDKFYLLNVDTFQTKV